MEYNLVAESFYQPKHPFLPHSSIRSGLVQTLLARRTLANIPDIQSIEDAVLLDGGPDNTGYHPERSVRLLGYYTPQQTAFPSKGLVLMLHGWEGCSHSPYNLSATATLISAGYDVFRLNVRDHGPGHHVDPYALNTGVFMGTLLEEVAIAVTRVAESAQGRPFFIVGPSLGGNFALRLALRHSHLPIPHLQHVVSISPALNPNKATDALDTKPLYCSYFRKRWLHSLLAKQSLFPQHFDFLSYNESVICEP